AARAQLEGGDVEVPRKEHRFKQVAPERGLELARFRVHGPKRCNLPAKSRDKLCQALNGHAPYFLTRRREWTPGGKIRGNLWFFVLNFSRAVAQLRELGYFEGSFTACASPSSPHLLTKKTAK